MTPKIKELNRIFKGMADITWITCGRDVTHTLLAVCLSGMINRHLSAILLETRVTI